MKVLFINNQGGGFADYVSVDENMQTSVENCGGGRSKTAAPGLLYIPPGVGCQFYYSPDRLAELFCRLRASLRR